MPDSIFNDIVRYKARKLAEKHIKRFTSDPLFTFEDCQREINNSYWKRKSVDFTFDRAYEWPWAALGAEDALKGRKRFDVPAYLTGWRNQVLTLTFDGWVNPDLIQRFGFVDEIIRPYASRIRHELNQMDFDKE